MGERHILLSVHSVRRYYVLCDTCPDPAKASRGPKANQKMNAIVEAKQIGWVIEDNCMVCPDCLVQRRIDACAARDEGHRWMGMLGLEPGEDGWYWVADNAFGVRQCADCPFREVYHRPSDTRMENTHDT